MATQIQHLHFVIVPLMSQSHLIPMTDFARLLAQRGLIVTVVTTPLNASRFKPIIDRATRSGLKIQLIALRFPCHEAGLPQGFENLDTITSPDMIKQFITASGLLEEPLENLLAELEPRPSCVITSNALPWTADVARRLAIPRFVFNAVSCFTLLCCHMLSLSEASESASLDADSFVVPNLPHRIEFTKAQLPPNQKNSSSDLGAKMKEALVSAQGVLVNSFEEMEPWYVEGYKNVNKKTWCIGPVSLCNKDTSDKCDRGKKASIDEHHCFMWLDSKKPNSVVYACFGSLCHIPPPQLMEIGLGLEASNRPFIWIIRAADCSAEMEKWLAEEKFEERNKDMGLVIRGWAPQVSILSHPSVGGFLTHCGWNSTLEGISAGVPMISWPMFAEQFLNEKLITDVLRIGVRIGVEVGMKWGEEEKFGVLVKREQVQKAVEQVINERDEGEERRKRARELGEKARRAMEEGGSSYFNITLLIQEVIRHVEVNNLKDSTQLERSSERVPVRLAIST